MNDWPPSPREDGQEDYNHEGYDDADYGEMNFCSGDHQPEGDDDDAHCDEMNLCQEDGPEYGDHTPTKDFSPHTVGQVSGVNEGCGKFTFFKTLFDSGSSINMFKRSAIPRGMTVHALENGAKGIQTAMGAMKVSYFVNFDTLSFPEFSQNWLVPKVKALVFEDNQVGYDLIIGRKTMLEMELKLDFSDQSMEWMNKKVSFHPTNWYSDKVAVRKVLVDKDNDHQQIRGGGPGLGGDPGYGDDDEEEDEYEETYVGHGLVDLNPDDLPMPTNMYNEEYSKFGGKPPSRTYVRPGDEYTPPTDPINSHLSTTHTIRPGAGVHPNSDGTSEHYVTRTNGLACMDRRDRPLKFLDLEELNTTATRWDNELTLGDASRGYFGLMEECMHYHPHPDILGNEILTKNCQVNKRNSFMRGHVAGTIGRIIMGPDYNFAALQNVSLRDMGTKYELSPLEASLIFRLAEVYSAFWDPTISANEILEIKLKSHEEQCGAKMKLGFWSDEEVMSRMKARERLDNNVCRGMAWPYVKACDQILKEFYEKQANKKAPTNMRYITDEQKVEWRDAIATRTYRYG